jgi:hypothetical protein
MPIHKAVATGNGNNEFRNHLPLKAVRSGGAWCARCAWNRLCRGCAVPCTGEALRAGAAASSFYAVDWDPTALHLRYLAAAERAWVEDPSVAASRRAATGQFMTVPYCISIKDSRLGIALVMHQISIKTPNPKCRL